MPTIAVKIVDPADQQWAQLLEAAEPVRRLLPPLVERLGLPETPAYELVDLGSDRVLRAAETLAEAGLEGGEDLLLRPVRDAVLAAFLDALYEEAVGYVAGQAFEQAVGALESLYRLDPTYPDKQGLWRKVASGSAVAGAAGAAGRASGGGRASPSKRSSGRSQKEASASGPGPARGGPAAQASSSGCTLILVVIAVVVALVSWSTGTLDRFGFPPWPFGPDDGRDPAVVDDGVVLGEGDVQVTLRWDNDADLDLHVVDPSGTEIYYGNRTSPSGGQLDVDAQGSCGGEPPVENVFWPDGASPSGSYAVEVVHFKSCTSTAPASYTVTVRVDRRIVDEQRGQIAPGASPVQAARFSR